MDVVLRPVRVLDAQQIFEAATESHDELWPWMPWCHPNYAIEESRAWLETQVAAFQSRDAFEFAIESVDGRYLGGCGLNQIDKTNRRANLGYWVRSSMTRRGVATAAVRRLRTWAFEETDLLRLEIVAALGNVASLRVAEKSGATREGTLSSRLLLHGTAHAAAVFSLVRPPVAGTSADVDLAGR